jgi:hypothetical protein
MKKKIDILLDFIRNDNRIEAIKLVSTFPRGVSKDEKIIVEVAAESYKGKESFYRSLGMDVDDYKKSAWEIILKNYSHQL